MLAMMFLMMTLIIGMCLKHKKMERKVKDLENQMTKLNAMDEIPTKTTNEQKNWYKINHLFHLNHTKKIKKHTHFFGVIITGPNFIL